MNGSSDLHYDQYHGEEWMNGSSDPIDTVHTVFAIVTSNKYSTYSIDSLSIYTHTVVLINTNIAYMIQS